MTIVHQVSCGFESTHQEAQNIYNHLLECVQKETPDRVIERFRYLFIKGTGYDNYSIKSALDTIVDTHYAEREFPFFLNRCFHIIINSWQMQPTFKQYIPSLISQLELALPPGTANSKTTRKLRKLVKDFQNTEQYVKLKRLSNLINQKQKHREQYADSVGNLIQRYPYLHQHCLLSDDSSYEFKKTIKTIQKTIQNRYEIDLSQYITYRVRLVEIVRKYRESNQTRVSKKIIQPVKNPTLLSDRSLDRALQQYLGKVESGYNYRDLSLSFIKHNKDIKSYKQFKNNLYEYLTFGIDSNYGKHQFNHRLYQHLQDILPDFHPQAVDEFILIRTCSSLLKFLVVDSIKNPEHYLFVDLIANLGATQVIALLLKIVLICHKIKPYLEQRFSILFSHYESFTKDGVPWLISSLENLQLAFSIYFGKADLSLVRLM